MVPEDQDVLEPHVSLEIETTVAVGKQSAVDLLAAHVREASVVLGALDNDLVGADAVHHVVHPESGRIEVAFDHERRELVRNYPDGPAWSVGQRLRRPVAENLGRSHQLVSRTERAVRTERGPATRILTADFEIRGAAAPFRSDDHPLAGYRISTQLGQCVFAPVPWVGPLAKPKRDSRSGRPSLTPPCADQLLSATCDYLRARVATFFMEID